jgi:hypothetical protein
MRTDPSSRDMRREKTAKLADQRRSAPEAKRSSDKTQRGVQVAANSKTKGKTADVAERTKTKTADSRERRPSNVSSAARGSRPGNVRVAANGRAPAERACTQSKGSGRKGCRQA